MNKNLLKKTLQARKLKLANFTLIELLIVIAIIAILASMLLPALQQARVASLKSACINNMKQVSTGAFAYADIYNDFLPPTSLEQSVETNYYGRNVHTVHIAMVLGFSYELKPGETQEPTLTGKLKSFATNKIFVCPATKPVWGYDNAVGSSSKKTFLTPNYRPTFAPDDANKNQSPGWSKNNASSKVYGYDPRKLNQIVDGTALMIEVTYTAFTDGNSYAYFAQTSNACTNTYQNQELTSSNFSYKIDL